MRHFLEEFLPLLLFLGLSLEAHRFTGASEAENIYYATAGFMLAFGASLVSVYGSGRKPTPMMLLSGFLVFVFGGLTLLLHDERFIKIKPTLVYMLFGLAMCWGNWRNTPIAKVVMGKSLALTAAGWRTLSWRWAGLFFALALANELVWRNVETQVWVQFKVLAIPAIIIAFTLAQLPLIKRSVAQEPHSN